MPLQYNLRWINHQPNFISMFGNFLAKKHFVDVTLAAEGQHLLAHKVVLSACSTYFHSLFVDNPSHHPIVILKDVTFNDLRTMVDFMYYGEINVREEQLPQVLETAKILKIKGLAEMPDSPSVDNMNETQSLSVTSFSEYSPTIRRKRHRIISSGLGENLMTDDSRSDDCGQNMKMMREAVTLSSVPQQKRRELDERMENSQQVLETAKILKIKGLTEMPDSPSVDNMKETQSLSVTSFSEYSPTIRRKRHKIISSGSGVNLMTDDNRSDDCGIIISSSVPQQKREELDERMENSQKTADSTNINKNQLPIYRNAVGMSQSRLPLAASPKRALCDSGNKGARRRPTRRVYSPAGR